MLLIHFHPEKVQFFAEIGMLERDKSFNLLHRNILVSIRLLQVPSQLKTELFWCLMHFKEDYLMLFIVNLLHCYLMVGIDPSG